MVRTAHLGAALGIGAFLISGSAVAHAEPADPRCATARVSFAGDLLTAAVWQGRVGACQFHPEKSGPSGEAMLRSWLAWLQQSSGR